MERLNQDTQAQDATDADAGAGKMTRPWSRRWSALLVGLAVACGGDTSDPEGMEETLDGATVILSDSAGVQIIESVTASWDTDGLEWAVADSPTVRIGSPDDTLMYLAGVQGVAVGPSGEIAIGNLSFDEVSAFSADGAPLWRQGRTGSGPGEYERITDVRSCGDYIVVRDSDLRRLTFLNWAGEVEGSRSYGETREMSSTAALDCNDRGQFAQLSRALPASGMSGPYTANAILRVGELESGEGRIVLDAPGFQRHRSSITDAPSDLGMRTMVAISDSLLHVVVTDRPELRSHVLTGDLVRIARWPAAVQQITPELLRELAARRAQVLPERLRSAYETEWVALPHPEQMAFVDELVLSSTGDVWLRRFDGYADRSEQTQWWVLSEAGAWQGTVSLPAGFQLLAVTADEVVGLTRDELNVEYVEVREIQRVP